LDLGVNFEAAGGETEIVGGIRFFKGIGGMVPPAKETTYAQRR
jgi:hypothetical protein